MGVKIMKRSQAVLALSAALSTSYQPFSYNRTNEYYDGGTFQKSKIKAKRKAKKLARRRNR